MTSPPFPELDMANAPFAAMPQPHLSRRPSRCSSYRSSRVEKPKSTHNSPVAFDRRKAMAGSKRYSTLEDHFNMMFGIAGEDAAPEDYQEPARPYSWHPSSSQFQVPPRPSTTMEQSPMQEYALSSRNSTQGSDFYSLSARSSLYPEQMQTYLQPLDAHRGSQDSGSSWQQHGSNLSPLTPATEPMPWYLQEWARKNQAELESSRNPSVDFLPIQRPSVDVVQQPSEDEDMLDAGKDLVGMGLYDLPESETTWGSATLLGKGLKLEETWQPPEEDEDDEDAEDEDDSSSEDGSVEDLPVAEEPPKLPMPDVKPQLPGNMEGQSFFFDEEQAYTKDWWFQQLRQPVVPARDAGLGYNWL